MNTLRSLLKRKPIGRLEKALIENRDKINISKDGAVSMNLDNPEVIKDIQDIIIQFKDVELRVGRDK
jgi:hypothetical protein